MNTSKTFSTALIAIASLSAASAFAGDSDYPGAQTNSTVSINTRAQVRAEYLQAKREGTLIQTDDNYPVVAAKSSGKTRAEVTAELADAQRAGYLTRSDNS